MLESPTNTQYLVRRVQAMIKQAYPKEQNLDLDDHHIENVLMWAAKRLTFLQDLTDSKLSFLWVRPNDFKLKTNAVLNRAFSVRSIYKRQVKWETEKVRRQKSAQICNFYENTTFSFKWPEV
ncbi:nondiscriminating glutamyl-tRNA synthetase EARS2, mitochondrial-like isoform X4 [Eurosta solidaginis]|uniref:nondiscriminating glutamyl-tRNA synthetase EARS2, mitochondrial-like isoform X4 n=1 Tax=Eurosta solidaginis TaxID=178769 RepID=UPI003530F61B